jgi:hypothetical protein
MTALLETKYEQRFLAVKEEINVPKYACFTTDMWDTRNHKKSFLRFKIS